MLYPSGYKERGCRNIKRTLEQAPKRPGDYDPTFPKPVSIGVKAVGWIESEIDDWLNAQVQKSRAAA
jgi:prophage regulatory protein